MRDPAGARRRYGLLLAATLLSLAVQGISPPGTVQQVVVSALSGGSVVLALRAAQVAPRWVLLASSMAVAVLVLTIVRVTIGGVDDGAARAANAALLLIGPPAVAFGVLREVRSSRDVRMEAVAGVLSLYILVGMVFAFLYGAVDQLGGAPFFAQNVPATIAQCLYFSFVTLTTVGYGDLTPRSDLGHTMAVFEALLGQIYLVTVVSLLVSNLRPHRDRSD